MWAKARALAIFLPLPLSICSGGGAKINTSNSFYTYQGVKKCFFIRVWPSSRAKFPRILLHVTQTKKVLSYTFAKNRINFDKLQGFQVPLISPNALIIDLYIIQSAKTYFIGLEYDYISIHESSLLLFQFEAYDGAFSFMCRIKFP